MEIAYIAELMTAFATFFRIQTSSNLTTRKDVAVLFIA
ncbi:hypothetical protein BofuT4_uP076880.1 [Botrytis cinerea T4]|uniref:Uncharacterized protein n=1 Tax=Botryotinia fuckeliana (strain T4) TaxID=999810 RepID=G2XNZ9_BOTF4|nr:hypothetical protein BofuT4_uP076880.1 [Botrytis cinerea T4]